MKMNKEEIKLFKHNFYLLRKKFFIIFFLIFPLSILTALSTNIKNNSLITLICLIILVSTFIYGGFIQIKLNNMICPKCKNKFFSSNSAPSLESAISFPHQKNCSNCRFKPF
jgi:hypothetical protein